VQLDLYRNNDLLMIKVAGRVVLDDCERFKSSTMPLIQPGLKKVAVEMSQVEFIDSAGLGVLVGLKMTSNKAKAKLSIISPSQAVGDILYVSKLDGIFEVVTGQPAELLRGEVMQAEYRLGQPQAGAGMAMSAPGPGQGAMPGMAPGMGARPGMPPMAPPSMGQLGVGPMGQPPRAPMPAPGGPPLPPGGGMQFQPLGQQPMGMPPVMPPQAPVRPPMAAPGYNPPSHQAPLPPMPPSSPGGHAGSPPLPPLGPPGMGGPPAMPPSRMMPGAPPVPPNRAMPPGMTPGMAPTGSRTNPMPQVPRPGQISPIAPPTGGLPGRAPMGGPSAPPPMNPPSLSDPAAFMPPTGIEPMFAPPEGDPGMGGMGMPTTGTFNMAMGGAASVEIPLPPMDDFPMPTGDMPDLLNAPLPSLEASLDEGVMPQNVSSTRPVPPSQSFAPATASNRPSLHPPSVGSAFADMPNVNGTLDDVSMPFPIVRETPSPDGARRPTTGSGLSTPGRGFVTPSSVSGTTSNNPKDMVQVHLSRAFNYMRQGSWEDSVREYRKALDIDTECLTALNNLAIVYEKRPSWIQQALETWQKVAEISKAKGDQKHIDRAQKHLASLRKMM